MEAAISTLALTLALCSATWAAGPSRDPTINPDAVPHQIDRSAMKVQIRGGVRTCAIRSIPSRYAQVHQAFGTTPAPARRTTPNSTSLNCAARLAMRPLRC